MKYKIQTHTISPFLLPLLLLIIIPVGCVDNRTEMLISEESTPQPPTTTAPLTITNTVKVSGVETPTLQSFVDTYEYIEVEQLDSTHYIITPK